ncbi:hypothetical protein Tdes44962_MAKER02815 [Teratosphaeria destructans]|uniref:Uncharacterized protein n=1 Tax=Teratosphaeria destructans TaxID=418781 RepID=A0A9W7W273_9PEZI|nr:hypothetical protein Tdes44962_MAKER02815 [Teratosphaeria destructans]
MTKADQPANLAAAEAAPFGLFPSAFSPRYHAPMSVSLPFCVSIAAFGPTLLMLERNAPKYE